MAHFTYVEDFDKTCLKQGDVLKKSDELSAILKTVHPYFNSANYNYFLVLTQSCDLVKRKNGKCNSRYITIAAIRPLEDALKREADEIISSDLERKTKRLLDEKNNSKLSEFLSRLLNNNIPEYFYLHDDVLKGFINPSVAFLRVSVALKSELHYEKCVSCKVLELEDNFKAKLGWLVGNLYSRVGTEDWVPNNMEQPEFNQLVKRHLESNFQIVPNIRDIEKELRKTYNEAQIEALTVEEIIEQIKKIKLPSRKDKVLLRLEEIISESNALKEGIDVKKIISKISNDPTITSFLK